MTAERPHRIMFLIAVALCLALGHAPAASAAPAASMSAAKKKAPKKKAVPRPCVRARVGGRNVCLRIGAPCFVGRRPSYLDAGLDCVLRKRKRVLVKAAPSAVRRGRYQALPPSGRPTLAQALAAFETTVADLPGVSVPAGTVGSTRSATSAVESLDGYRDQLPPSQRAALDTAISPMPTPTARAAQVVTMEQLKDEALVRLAQKGVVLRRPVTIEIAGAAADPTTFAMAYPRWLAAPNLGNSCHLTVYVKTLAAPLVSQRETMLHELVHCAQYEFMTSPDQRARTGKWIKEGTADWISLSIGKEWSGTNVDVSWWPTWLREPAADLFTRQYDAVGFFSLLAQKGANVYTLLGPLVQAPTPDAAYAVATNAVASDIVPDWGPTLSQVARLGAAWNLNGPGAPRPPLSNRPIGNGGSYFAEFGPRGGAIAGLSLTADIVRVTTSPGAAGKLRDSADGEHPLGPKMDFCLRPGGCRCPDEDNVEAGYPPLPKGQAYIGGATGSGQPAGLLGGGARSTISVTGEKLECKKEDRDAPGSGGRGPGLEVRGLDGGSQLLGRITKGSCRFTGNAFVATGSGDYSFSMRIAGARGPGEFTIPYNSQASFIKVGAFETSSPFQEGFPATPGGVMGPPGPSTGAAAAKIVRIRVRVGVGKKARTVTKHRLSVGASPLFQGGNPGVVLIPGPGGLVC